MRVVSQNKNFSFDFDRTVFWTQYNIIYAKFETESIAIGQYESEERAAEVFGDMHKALCGETVLFQNVEMPDDFQKKLEDWRVNGIITTIPGQEPRIESISNQIYFMPKE